MHITLPDMMDRNLQSLKFKMLPKTLFFRTMLLVFVPLIVVQIVSIIAYFNGSWAKIGKRLSDNLAANMAFVVTMAEQNPGHFDEVQVLAQQFYELKVDYSHNDEKYKVLDDARNDKMVTGFLEASMQQKFPNAKTQLYLQSKKKLVALVDTKDGLYRFETSTKNIFNSSIFGFIAWMIGTSLLLFVVSTLFLRVQARSIRQLAEAAENFGKGVDVSFKPYGSSEVRTAGVAFNKMKERIKRQMSERVQMLAGVSHDLKTPLTRMKLRLAMQKQDEDNQAFLEDVVEMQQMLEGYLAFARGEGSEENTTFDFDFLVKSIVEKFTALAHHIEYTSTGEVMMTGRQQALTRAVTNIISNACHYATNVKVSLNTLSNRLELDVEDDGPGIPEDKREDVFKAFYRLEESRNKQTGGVGLGLSIARDVVRTHGGTIKLSDGTLGGLKVEIRLPL
ncbi:MAG: ATP-binding protein [Alphaproteobacteria bacterium]|nr:ATP-binding protein [Alphaproteobacteria bacterium]